MPPQIKQDLNRSGWESTDFPSVCEQCLPDNPYVQMLKDDYGSECSICTRPYTLFTWKADRTSRQKKTNICLTCARLKNCCQCCMLDLSFGLPLAIRDAALQMVAPGPRSDINRQYYAQEHEQEIEDGRGAIEEAYSKTDGKARDLLRRLANSEPYYKKQRRAEAINEEGETREGNTNLIGWRDEDKGIISGGNEKDDPRSVNSRPGPARTPDNRTSRRPGPYTTRKIRKGGPPAATPSRADIEPPADQNVMSLFLTGVEDDLPEHELRKYFSEYGVLRSLVCSHRAHCAFINFATREGAEKAAASCQGRAVIRGCPLRVGWGKPRQLDNMDNEERIKNARQGRDLEKAAKLGLGQANGVSTSDEPESIVSVTALPPGKSDIQYASLKGD